MEYLTRVSFDPLLVNGWTREKICSKCKEKKSLSLFQVDKRQRDGCGARCKACNCAESRVRYKRMGREIKARLRVDYQAHPEKYRNMRLRTLYGISISTYSTMLMKQNGVCAICSRPEICQNQSGARPLNVDHSHRDGQVRGLLCNSCNLALGLMRDDIDIVDRMANYLKQWEKR